MKPIFSKNSLMSQCALSTSCEFTFDQVIHGEYLELNKLHQIYFFTDYFIIFISRNNVVNLIYLTWNNIVIRNNAFTKFVVWYLFLNTVNGYFKNVWSVIFIEKLFILLCIYIVLILRDKYSSYACLINEKNINLLYFINPLSFINLVSLIPFEQSHTFK